MKKYLTIFTLVAIATICVVKVNSSNNLDALVIANVEALANTETSVYCDQAFLSKCRVKCSQCGLEIDARGHLRELSHSCNN